MLIALAACKHVPLVSQTTAMQGVYQSETFVHVLAKGQIPHTRHVRGSNYNLISVFEDRLSGRAIIISGAPSNPLSFTCI